jgi:hypothetical protein
MIQAPFGKGIVNSIAFFPAAGIPNRISEGIKEAESMKTRRINVYLFIGMIGLFTTGPALFTQMYRAFCELGDVVDFVDLLFVGADFGIAPWFDKRKGGGEQGKRSSLVLLR